MPLPPTVLIANIPVAAEVYHATWAVAALYGLPPWLLGGVEFAESGFDPAAHCLTPSEQSYGLLQLNTQGGQGAGIPVQLLCNPAINLLIGAAPIAHAYQRALARGLSGLDLLLAVLASSGHNRSDGQVTDDVVLIAARVLSLIINPDGTWVVWPQPWS